MLNHPYELHENDRRAKARELDLPLKKFDELLENANRVYNFMVETGPYYGNDDQKEPTFRITAEPVKLNTKIKKILQDLGNDLLFLGRVLHKLPDKYKKEIGGELIDYRVPLFWRIDAILGKDGEVKVNEIEGIDSASALMMAEQLAYNLMPVEETTVAKFVQTLDKMGLIPQDRFPLRIAILRYKISTNPLSANAKRFVELVRFISKGKIECELFDLDELREGVVKPDWNLFEAVITEAYVSPKEMASFGIAMEKLLTSGNYNALVNKGLFAVFFAPELTDFWKIELGLERYQRLTNVLIPSQIIEKESQIDEARKLGKVAKITWGEDLYIVNVGRGVAMPAGEIKQNTDERWSLLHDYFKQGYTVISQDYVEPAKISAYLRKKGTGLEHVEWHNRICVKYVVDGDPNGIDLPEVNITATEVTLGPDVVPAGRACAYTAVDFK